MKLFGFFCLLILSTSLLAEVKSELSGNIEAQVRHAKNNPLAKKDLFQDWDRENFYLFYGNLNGKVEMSESRVETNLFARYSQSELYDPKPNILGQSNPYLATAVFTFPQKLVARDLFKLQHSKQAGNQKVEAVINKLYYETDLEDSRFMMGRMYVNYGLGEIFNPINPFNQPTGLTSISQVAQGNDGISFTAFVSNIHTIQFLILGDKSIENYEGEIDRTIWVHGEYQAGPELQFDYVLGEDQNRQKLGGQLSYRFTEAMVFSQFLYQTQSLKNEDSNNLVDALLGYDQQITSLWHLRMESGYQKTNRFFNPQNAERFLPTEYFIALANVVELHPLFKVNGTLINDIKSGFAYFIAKATYDFGNSIEAEIFGFTPAARGDQADNVAQKLVTTDVGFSLRAFF